MVGVNSVRARAVNGPLSFAPKDDKLHRVGGNGDSTVIWEQDIHAIDGKW